MRNNVLSNFGLKLFMHYFCNLLGDFFNYKSRSNAINTMQRTLLERQITFRIPTKTS